MLAEERRRGTDRTRRGRQLHRQADLADRAEDRVLHGDRHRARTRLGQGERGEDVVDRAARDLCLGQGPQPGPRGRRGEASRQDRPQRIPVRDASPVRGEARVERELRDPHRRAEADELPIRADGDRDLPVGGRERLVRDDVRVGVAAPRRRRARHERVLGLVHEAGEGRFEDRHVDPLPAPGGRTARPVAAKERAEDADRAEQPGQDVRDRHADLARMAAVGVGEAGDRHEARLGLEHEVVAGAVGPGPGRAVAADAEVDERRVDLGQGRVVEAEPVEPADAEVLDEHVGAPQEAPQHGRAVGCLEVEPDRALVAVDREVVRGGPGIVRPGQSRADPWRAPRPRPVPVGRLDLDHVGPEVGEEHRAEGSREDRRAVGDADPGQGSGHGPGTGTRPWPPAVSHRPATDRRGRTRRRPWRGWPGSGRRPRGGGSRRGPRRRSRHVAGPRSWHRRRPATPGSTRTA